MNIFFKPGSEINGARSGVKKSLLKGRLRSIVRSCFTLGPLNAQCISINKFCFCLSEVVTRLSEVCCQQVVKDGALPVIFKVIKKCNRSLPHLEVIKYSLAILYNVVKVRRICFCGAVVYRTITTKCCFSGNLITGRPVI